MGVDVNDTEIQEGVGVAVEKTGPVHPVRTPEEIAGMTREERKIYYRFLGKPMKTTPRHQEIARLAAMGIGPKDIAEKVRMTRPYVLRILRQPEVQARIKEIQDQNVKVTLSEAAKQMTGSDGGQDALHVEMTTYAMDAVRELYKVMTSSESDLARAKAAGELLDRTNFRYVPNTASVDLDPSLLQLFVQTCEDLKNVPNPESSTDD